MEKQKFTEIEKMAEIVKSYCKVCPNNDWENETCLICQMEHLYNHGYRLQKTTYMLKTDGTLEMIPTVESVRQTTAKEIIDFANEVIEFFENDATVDDEHKVYFKLAMRFFQTKIMERYGV